MKKIYGWCITNSRGGILTESERLPIYWYRGVAKKANNESEFWGKVVKVEIKIVESKEK